MAGVDKVASQGGTKPFIIEGQPEADSDSFCGATLMRI